MARYYVVPDTHGESALLAKALAFIYSREPKGGKIIFLGDYVDRGPDAPGVLDLVMNPPEGWKFVCLMGNHEQMLLRSLRLSEEFYDLACVRQFIPGAFQFEPGLLERFPKKYLDWLLDLELVCFEGKNVFAHAYWAENASVEAILWNRLEDSEPGPADKYLIHGHTPRRHGPVEAHNRTNLDCGVHAYGRLVIAEMEYERMGPVGYHEFLRDVA